jgi:hypothetical protein
LSCAIASAGDAAADAVLPSLRRSLRNSGRDASVVAAAAAAAAATARAATIEGSAILTMLMGDFAFCGEKMNFWSMEVNVGMTPKITPQVLL